MRQMVVRNLITPGTTSSNAIEYAVETDDPNVTGAAVVSEGQLKPQSNITFDLKSTPVRTIAHFMKASRQIMDDAPQLRSIIDGRLTYGLQFVEEGELLYGDGTGQHILGIVPQASAYAPAFAPTNPTPIDQLRLASLQATLALYPASGYVLHPTDWGRIELTKDLQGRYIVGDPTGLLGKRLWNLPVVDTQAMQVGKFLTGAFQLGAQIFDRMSIEILISTENADDFVRNMITIRGEERLTLAVYRPAAFIYGTLP
jgi:HK97 family phage major capsid protein